MAQAANAFADDAPVERQPGQLQRSKQGTPYVADPAGDTVKSGPRKGLVKMLPYGRPSGFGKQIEDGYNLAKWSERQVSLGIGLDYAAATEALALPELAAACAHLASLDRESKEFREAADAVIVEAKRIAKSGLAAERGTHAHALTEDDDDGRDWILRAEHGEILDVPIDAQRLLVDAWRTMLARNGLEVLASEFIVVHDDYRMAGTADRLARLTRPLRFTLIDGTAVDLPAGTVVVLDIKSGKHRTDNRGAAMYWQAYAVQIATYAGGVLYDPDTDVRTPYPWPVDQRRGLIAHLDVLGAIDGIPSCELIIVDLEAGRHAAGLCLAAKAWEKRKDVFSVQQIVDVDLPQVADEPAVAGPAGSPVTPESATANPPCTFVGRRRPSTTSIVHRTLDSIDEGNLDGLDVAFAALAHHYRDLDNTGRAWIGEIQTGAKVNGQSFKAAEAHTVRRFELLRGLITLAAAGDADDDLVRIICWHVTDDSGTLAALVSRTVGCLDATQATAFAAVCDQIVADQLSLTFDDDGTPRLVPNLAPRTAA